MGGGVKVNYHFLCFWHIHVYEVDFAPLTKFIHHWTMASLITEQGHNDGNILKLDDKSCPHNYTDTKLYTTLIKVVKLAGTGGR